MECAGCRLANALLGSASKGRPGGGPRLQPGGVPGNLRRHRQGGARGGAGELPPDAARGSAISSPIARPMPYRRERLVGDIEEVRADLACGGRQNFILIGASGPGYRGYEDVVAAGAESEPDVAVAAGETGALTYTSGTTGKPKGAIRSHQGSALLSLVTDVGLGFSRRDAGCWPCPCAMPTRFTSSARSPIAGRRYGLFGQEFRARGYAAQRWATGAPPSPRRCPRTSS